MDAEQNWNHPAFFDYVHCWMTEDDTNHIAYIDNARGWDLSTFWARQQAQDDFVEDIWSTYYTE